MRAAGLFPTHLGITTLKKKLSPVFTGHRKAMMASGARNNQMELSPTWYRQARVGWACVGKQGEGWWRRLPRGRSRTVVTVPHYPMEGKDASDAEPTSLFTGDQAHYKSSWVGEMRLTAAGRERERGLHGCLASAHGPEVVGLVARVGLLPVAWLLL